jgi:hypothetical protein
MVRLGLRRVVRGTVYAYKVVDENSGEWLFNVQFSEERRERRNVVPVTSERASWLHDRIKRKTDVFQPPRTGTNISIR